MTPSLSPRTALAALAVVATFALTGILTGAPPALAQQSGAGTAEDPVVATVDGEKVMLSDLHALHADLPEQVRNVPFERIYRPLLNQVIQTKLLAAKARAEGLDKTPKIARRLRTLTERMLHHSYLDAYIDKSVTEDRLAEAYKAFVASHRGEDEIKARHILVKTRKEAMAAIEALEKGGSFARLASERSIGPSKAGGGDLGWFARGQMVKPFADAAFALEKGAFTDTPVKTQFGWHVILVEDRRRTAPPPFEAKRAELKRELGGKLMAAEVERLSKAAKIVRFGPDGKPLDDAAPARKEDGQEKKQ
ncbi:MAG: peptidylprolyl isomerase [Rhodospirillaceae bacterium]|nr:peptidylprolyl isomerase [Rhodospirillaceae bacterium]